MAGPSRAWSRRWRRAALLAASLFCLIAGACGRGSSSRPASSSDSLPPPALGDRAQRDSARVAQLLLAYYDFVVRRDTASVRRLFYPESIEVATPDGGVVVEGQGSALLRDIAAGPGKASRIRRILLLRRVTTEMLEQTYRESWLARFVPDRADSAAVELRFHVIEPLGQDTRWLGHLETP